MVRRPEILAVLIVVFSADVVAGISLTTLSLYSVSLGASLALVGIITGIGGITSIFTSVPIGALSDTRGRKVILSTGILLFAISTFLYTIVPTAVLLLPIRVLSGIGVVSVFMVGIAYLGDMVQREERGLAIGLYTTAMGLGFAVGPALAGFVSSVYGYRASFRVAALIAFVGWLVAIRFLASGPGNRVPGGQAESQSTWSKLRVMVTEPGLLGASVANLGNNLVFMTVFSFFPLYLAGLSVGAATLGAMFSVRALVSTLARLPTGLLSMRIRNRYLMTMSLAVSAFVLFGVSQITSRSWLIALMMVDGIAYGMFLTAGQAHVTNLSKESDRGSAVGIYSTAGSIGSTIGPMALGFVAASLGLAYAFRFAAVLVVITTIAFWLLGVYAEKDSYHDNTTLR